MILTVKTKNMFIGIRLTNIGHALMLKILTLQAIHLLWEELYKYLIEDRQYSCDTSAKKKAIEKGRVPDDCQEELAKLAQLDRDARWTINYTKAKLNDGEGLRVNEAIPALGYKCHVSIESTHGPIHNWTAAHDAAREGTPDRKNSSIELTRRVRSLRARSIARQRMKRCSTTLRTFDFCGLARRVSSTISHPWFLMEVSRWEMEMPRCQ
jgi:hypothetical protein